MEGRPDPPDALVDTGDGLLDTLQLLAAGLLEQGDLVDDLLGLEVAHADGLFAAIDVLALDDGVSVRTGGDADLDLGVLLGDGGEFMLQEGAVDDIVSERYQGMIKRNQRHTPCPGSSRPSRSSESPVACIGG